MVTELQDAIIDELADQMREAMDFVIVADICEAVGWTRLEVVYGSDQPWVAVKEWAGRNFEGEHQEHNGTWLIEEEKDATMFALKWRCE